MLRRLAGDGALRTEAEGMWRVKCISTIGVFLAAGMVCAEESPAPVPVQSGATSHTAAAGTLDHRFKVLAKALDLDGRQQAELWRILEDQRQAVRKIWTDPALLSAERGPATRAVQDRTADQIRAILTDEQRKRYNPPKPLNAASESPDVGAWMDVARGVARNPSGRSDIDETRDGPAVKPAPRPVD
jgi:hypothetical protein